MERWQVWIDTGGTFTDCIAIDAQKNVHRIKVLSSSRIRCRPTYVKSENHFSLSLPFQPDRDILTGYRIRKLLGKDYADIVSYDPASNYITISKPFPGLMPNEEMEICSREEVPLLAVRILTQTRLDQRLPEVEMRLGSTKGTNALLERKGARVGFIVTNGFRDLIEIGNQQRPNIFSLNIRKPKPYYSKVWELNERMTANGDIMTEPSAEEISKLVENLNKHEVESVAVALLHSYRNPVNEKLLSGKLRDSGFNHISISSDLSSSIKILPRAETTIANAYLDPVIKSYVSGIRDTLGSGSLKVMTSAGGLIDSSNFHPKDSLLSGPAGGLVGAVRAAEKSKIFRIITLDMGGTSTDVARYDQKFDYRFETKVGDARIQSPALYIETIAAGGGSICAFDGFRFTVGPESAGADPGPACYGAGGPLTLTDVNLLSGRIDPSNFGIPINAQAGEQALIEIKNAILEKHGREYSCDQILDGFLKIANEKMAEAIKRISTAKGFSPMDYTLVAFGGAGGQHACSIASILGMKQVLIPNDAGLLSALGIGEADVERIVSRQVLRPWQEVEGKVPLWMDEIEGEVRDTLILDGVSGENIHIKDWLFYLRLQGQDQTIELSGKSNLPDRFQAKYENLFGHWIKNKGIELESIKVVAAGVQESLMESAKVGETDSEIEEGSIQTLLNGVRISIPTFDWQRLRSNSHIKGPALVGSRTCTLFFPEEWELDYDNDGNLLLTMTAESSTVAGTIEPEEALLELFTNRLSSITEEMGAMMQRTSFSVNIKERLDFSCAILDPDGFLVVNAPHIPVHLGSMGMCVRSVRDRLDLAEGDVAITNHPKYGGSHLPDITLISPVHLDGRLLGYVANRGHHAEVGGTRPGSMPPDATNLEEEGVVIEPMFLVRKSQAHWDKITGLFTSARYPTRSIKENIADLNGALASIRLGAEELQELARKHSAEFVLSYMQKIKHHAHASISEALAPFDDHTLDASEQLDNGANINVSIKIKGGNVKVDFEGTSDPLKDNLNATPAITTSAVLYVLRLLTNKEIPLNEGMLQSVDILLPRCLLNPDFSAEPYLCPAVVGGNTETSQRLVDTLLKAFGIAGCSQGTMNNLLFGNDSFGFYETICGGVGATDGWDAADAVHQHMTNTRITDPEIMELRYPVILERFAIRDKSGGDGKWKGGNGVIRKLRFTRDLDLTILSQHREIAPYGMAGGSPGAVGQQFIETAGGERVNIAGSDKYAIKSGDSITILTPGGGGFGKPGKRS